MNIVFSDFLRVVLTTPFLFDSIKYGGDPELVKKCVSMRKSEEKK